MVEPFTFSRGGRADPRHQPDAERHADALYQRWWDFFNEGLGVHLDAFHRDDELRRRFRRPWALSWHACPRPRVSFADNQSASIDPPNNFPTLYIALGVLTTASTSPRSMGYATAASTARVRQAVGLFDTTTNSNLIIFEAALPNLEPGAAGIEGAAADRAFWADLSADRRHHRDPRPREDFYFVDAAGAGPVVHADNLEGPKW